jgi:molecular chaperone GrpE (heat shock protein)
MTPDNEKIGLIAWHKAVAEQRGKKIEELEANLRNCENRLLSANSDISNYKERNQKLREALKLQDEYVALLVDEIDSLIPMAHTHGWHSKRAEKGKELRERIEAARKLLEAGE